MKIRHLIFGLLLFPQFYLNAQRAKIDSIDHFIEQNLERYGELPGLAITIVKDGKPIFTKTYGQSDVERSRPSTPNTPYYIASVTKTFVGVLAAQLESEGKFSLDDLITDFAPVNQFKDQSLFEGVTLQDLLSHTSGIANVPLGWRLTNNGEYSSDELIGLLENETVSRYNRKGYAYDNFGYHVFRLILESEFHMDWKALLKEKIFQPLGMNHSSGNMSDADLNEWYPALSYTGLNDDRTPKLTQIQKNDQTMHAAGGMISSIADMQQWLLVNMNKGEFYGKQAIPTEVFTKAHSRIAQTRGNPRRLFQDSGYGLGWNTGTYDKREAIYHTGGFDGYYALCSFLPEEGLGISILVNETHFGDNIGNLIVSFAYDLLLDKVKSSEEYSQQQAQVTQQVNRLQQAFAADRARRKTRAWKLSKDMDAFSGEYYNEDLGLMKVSINGENPQISIGISRAVGSQSNIKDAIRVEFRDGRGEDILFVHGKRKAMATIYRDKVFYRK